MIAERLMMIAIMRSLVPLFLGSKAKLHLLGLKRIISRLSNYQINTNQSFGACPIKFEKELRYAEDAHIGTILEFDFGYYPRYISCIQVLNDRKQRFEWPEKVVLADLLEFIKVHNPDVILIPYADTWGPLIVKKARLYGLEPTISRSGWFKSMASKS